MNSTDTVAGRRQSVAIMSLIRERRHCGEQPVTFDHSSSRPGAWDNRSFGHAREPEAPFPDQYGRDGYRGMNDPATRRRRRPVNRRSVP